VALRCTPMHPWWCTTARGSAAREPTAPGPWQVPPVLLAGTPLASPVSGRDCPPLAVCAIGCRTQESSPALAVGPTAGEGDGPAVASPVPALEGTDLGGTAVGDTDLGGTAVGDTDLGGTAVGDTDLGGTAVGDTDLGGTAVGDTDLGGTAVGDTGLPEGSRGYASHPGPPGAPAPAAQAQAPGPGAGSVCQDSGCTMGAGDPVAPPGPGAAGLLPH